MPTKPEAVSYRKMVKTALTVLAKKSRKGTSRQAIGKYLQHNYNIDMTDRRHVALLRRTLKTGVTTGSLQVLKGSYKLSAAAKKEPAAAKKVRKTKVKTAKTLKPKKQVVAKRKPSATPSAVTKKTKKAGKPGLKKK